MKRNFFFVIIFFTSLCAAQPLSLPLEKLSGEKTSLEPYLRKGPVYISFWALWCDPCKMELRALQQLANTYKDSALTILTVNTDTPKSISKVRSFYSVKGYTMEAVIDPDQRFFTSMNGKALPFSVLMRKDGSVFETRTGYLPGDEKEIQRLFDAALASERK